MTHSGTALTGGATRIGRTRRIAISIIGVLALACAAAGVWHVGARPVALRSFRPWSFRPWSMLAATILEVATCAWTVHVWSLILGRFEGPRPGYRNLLRAWRASTLARYLPGSVWSTASTMEIAGRIGASAIALPSSFLLLGALNLAGAVTVATLGGMAGTMVRGLSPVLAIGTVLGALLLVHPRVVNGAVGTGARLARRPAPLWRGTWAFGGMLLLLFVLTWLVYGIAFGFFVRAFVATDNTPWLQLAGVNALAFTAGFAAFFAPGGVGVREAALVVLLGPVVAAASGRVALAATSRVWLLLTEGIGMALVVAATRTAGRVVGTTPASRHPVRTRPPLEHDSRSTWLAGGDDTTVEVLTDTRAALAVITAACAGATRSILISQLALDADCAATTAGGEAALPTLLETIVEAARRGRLRGAPLDVRIVLNGGLLLDTTPALRRALAAVGAECDVEVRAFKAFPRVMHAKALVVDGIEAFIMGASFVNGYWDDARHLPLGDAGDETAAGARPLHDAAIRLRGAATASVSDWFEELWQRASSREENPQVPMRAPAPLAAPREDGVRLLRTMPCSSRSPRRTEILDGYLDAIGRARSFIYLESQYFSARPIAKAVRAALDAQPTLELIVLINQNPDVTAYRGWQDERLAEQGLLDHPRAGVFALWSAVSSPRTSGAAELTQVFVHSKVAVVDDTWATVGTANLDGASLHSYGDDFSSALGRRVFGRYCNYDLNVALQDGVGGAPHTGVAAGLRQQLWARHLGMSTSAMTARPEDGWLSLWRERAAGHVARLAAGDAVSDEVCGRGIALPYTPHRHPREQLATLGIDVARAGFHLRFDPSWLEVRCSPGWMVKLIPERLRRGAQR